MLGNNWHKKEMPLVSLAGMGGGLSSPAFLASLILNITKPTVFSPVDDTGVPDFTYNALSSEITDVTTSSINLTGTSGSFIPGSYVKDANSTIIPSDIASVDGSTINFSSAVDLTSVTAPLEMVDASGNPIAPTTSNVTITTSIPGSSAATNYKFTYPNGTSIGSPKLINSAANMYPGNSMPIGDRMLWIKSSNGSNNAISDSVALNGRTLFTDSSDQSNLFSGGVEFGEGYTRLPYDIASLGTTTAGDQTFATEIAASPGLLDIVTWTGSGTLDHDRRIPHSLGSVPGMIIVKLINGNQDWYVYHSAKGVDSYQALNNGTAFVSGWNFWGSAPTETDFGINEDNLNTKDTNSEYVAYVFAEDTPGKIKCGTYTGNSGDNFIDVGFQPNFVLIKEQNNSGYNWVAANTFTMTSQRYWHPGYPTNLLGSGTDYINNNSTSFHLKGSSSHFNESGRSYLYLAVAGNILSPDTTRLTFQDNTNLDQLTSGMTVTSNDPNQSITGTLTSDADLSTNTVIVNATSWPTGNSVTGPAVTATASGFEKDIINFTLADTTVSKASDGSLVEGSTIDEVLTVGERIQADTTVSSTTTVPVFTTTLYNGNGQSRDLDTGIDNTDKSLIWFKNSHLALTYPHILIDTVRGFSRLSSNNDQKAYSSGIDVTSFNDSGVSLTNATGWVNHPSGHDMVAWNFRAAPGFFDIQTYTGNSEGGTDQVVSHDLGSEPGMIILKDMDQNGKSWMVYHKEIGANYWVRLNTNGVQSGPLFSVFPSTPTSTTFSTGVDTGINKLNHNYISYLFADTPGKIKCGTYTGIGPSSQTIDCGFEPGFVLIKATDRASDWVVTDYKLMASGQFLHPNNEQELKTNAIVGSASNGFTVASGSGDVNNFGTKHIYMAIAKDIVMDIPFTVTPEATVSASSGNTIALSDISGPWSTGMKVRGIDLDLKDYPDAILAQDISLTSSSPTAEHTVNNWGDAVWQVATDAAFTQNVQTTSTALSASGTQSGPTFSYNSNTGYYVRTKYTALGQQSEWSDANYFVTQLALDIEKPTILTPGNDAGLPDFDYTAESSAITNVTSVQGGGRVSVNSNGWKSVTYGGGKFVAVSFSGSNRSMYSSDGINWTAAATANDSQSWTSVTYGDGKFVAVSNYGSGNRVMYSTNGINWTNASIDSSAWNSVIYADGKFVAVAQDGSTRIAYSTNGSSWNNVSNPVAAAQWKSVTYGNGKFVAVSGYGAGNRAMYSTNGTSWYATASSNDNNSWNSVVYGNGKFVAVARGGDSNLVMYSTDGINWTGTQPSSNASWTSVIYADGKFVAVAEGGTNRAMYSTDGINWTGVESADESNEWQSITYGDGKFVAVASNGNSNRVMYSYTGTHWGPDETTLTLTDTTVSKVSDGSLIDRTSIDQVLTVGETVRSETSSVIASAQVWSDNLTNISPIGSPAVYGGTSAFDGDTSTGGFTNGFNNIIQWTFSNLFGTLVVYGDPQQNHEKTIDGVSIGSEVADSEGRLTFNITESNTSITLKNVGRTYYTTANQFELNGIPIINNQPISAPTALGTVSASTGNTITLSGGFGTWSTGMKVQGLTTDNKDNPSAVDSRTVSFTSSEPSAPQTLPSGYSWDTATWQVATDENFTQNVQTATTALSATGTQTGPSFTLEKETGYYTRTKYTALGQESEWSDANYFVTAPSVYVDDVFSTYLYEGDATFGRRITNGIDLAGEGGLVWIKERTVAQNNMLIDTVRGATKVLVSNSYAKEYTDTSSLTAFNNDGFTINNGNEVNHDYQDFVSWTFRKAPGFFDIVTWDGDDTSGRAIPHGLGSTPGMVIVRCTTDTKNWPVWHRSLPNVSADYFLFLDTTDPENNPYQGFLGAPDASNFYVGANSAANGSGRSYVAYVFAHDDKSFGANSDESIIKCGSYTGTTSAIDLDLGFEPQWVMIKRATGTGQNFTNWGIFDNMRGVQPGQDALLAANLDHEENGTYLYANEDLIEFTSSGITIDPTGVQNTVVNSHGETYIYMAIRRPHKPATVVTDLFDIVTAGRRTIPPQFRTDFPVDLVLRKNMNDAGSPMFASRLQGTGTMSTAVAGTEDNASALTWDYQDGWSSAGATDPNLYAYMFKRSPGFMDVVTYTGTGVAQEVKHNLGVAPELMIVKRRSSSANWTVYSEPTGNRHYMSLNHDHSAFDPQYGQYWNNTSPTSSVFTVKSAAEVNANTATYVAYLFSTLPGVSKVGSYIGNGYGAQAVDCGFTNGAAFILVKNADSSGDWYLLDSERGINAYNETEPYITLNNAATQQTGNVLGYKNTGFMLTGQYGTASLNTYGEKYIFFAIANP